MNIYVAGPMRGIKDFNFPAFAAATARLRSEGHLVFNPAERDEETFGKDIGKSPNGDLRDAVQRGFSLRVALGHDMAWICEHADAIYLLPGWEASKGARAERALGEALGLEILAERES